MFLMNAPPVVALQSKWEAFGPPGGFRFPGCFSEPREGVARAAVSAEVQMIISTLQRDQAALGMSAEHALQKSQRADRGRDTGRAASPAFATCGLAADFDPKGEEETTDFGPLVLDSDSDDSVDRDIEEAIQEYLKARSEATQPPGAAAGDTQCKPEPPQSSGPTTLGPLKSAPGSGGIPGGVPGSHGGSSEDQGSASPVSVSSDDSFEQSIRAEIEQFLNEKRQHETQKCDVAVDRKQDPNDSLAKLAFRSSKEPVVKAPRQDLTGACKEFVFRKPPRFAKVNTQPRGLRSKVTPEPEGLGGTKPAAPKPVTACCPSEAAQNKGGAKRSVGPGRRGRRVKSTALVHDASDSSSDDGIEEAIQLYQLEKRKEAGGDPLQKVLPGEEKGLDPPTHSTSLSTKSALPETHRKTPSKKRPVATKAVDLGPGGLDPDHPCKPPKETKAAPPVNTTAKSEPMDRSSCRADTSAELMCAEAILDISKTILPAPREGSDRPPSASLLFHPPNVPSRSDGDSSSVDSDDSIEQEIRTFLALKAQSGSLLTRTETCPSSTHCPLPSPGPNGQAGGLKTPVSKTLDLSLGCKRKHRGGSSAVQPCAPKKTREVAKEGAQDADHSQGKMQPSQEKASEAPGREGESRGQPLPCRTGRLGEEHVAPDARGGVSPGHRKAAEARRGEEKQSSDDKSSSLDSDEDLDTAIKDLLRSKRKLKKRSKDPRAASKKKVRFSTTETQFLDQLGGFQKDWKDKSPHLLKSCLSKPKNDGQERPARKPWGVFCRETERTKATGARPGDAPPALRFRRRASEAALFCSEAEAGGLQGPAPSPSSLSDDSSSVDSDDSIELEIRKFLAEKAKESVSGAEIQGGDLSSPGPGARPAPELPGRRGPPAATAPPGVCTRSQRAAGRPSVPGGWSSPRAEQAGLPVALARAELAAPRSAGGTVSARGSPASRRSTLAHRDQSPRGPEPAAADGAFGLLPSSAEAGSQAEGPVGAFPGPPRSRGPLTRNPGAKREVPPASLTLPWGDFAPQSRPQSTWALSPEGRGAVWKGGLGSEREKGPQGQSSAGLTLDPKKGLPFAGFAPLLSTQAFHFGKSVSWGGKPAGLFSGPLSLPLQGPSFSAFRESPAGRGPLFGGPHLLLKKEGGHWPSRRSQAGLNLHNRRSSGAEENLLDLRYRRRVVDRDDEDPEALGSDASECSDTSVEEGGGPLAQGKVLKL
ncbi:protein phosphatase 1 regulatory subunit 26 [Equus asinus]|uniref:protein phosphatase 1 regulatory subunit 26 n=1 Tax=Equus asinus TaxID=9793 RepID=UPI000FC6329C